MQIIKQEKNQQQLGSDSFAHICPCVPSASETCSATATTVAIACVAQISIAPCSPLPLPHSPNAFLTYLRLALFLVPAHSVEAEIMTWVAWLHYRKVKQFLSCCSVTKGKTARDITLLPLPEGETSVSDWHWGQIQKVLAVTEGYDLDVLPEYQSFVDATLRF